MALFKAYKILENQLSLVPVKEGQLIFLTDKKQIYLDINNSERIQILPQSITDLENDSEFLIEEVDPVFSVSAAASISNENIQNWNNKQDAVVFNSQYNASTNKAATMSDVSSIYLNRWTSSDIEEV